MLRCLTHVLSLLLLITAAGCGSGPAGSEQAARSHFHKEFQQWIAGSKSEVTTMGYHSGLQPPIGYDIRSVAPESPDPLAFDRSSELPENWREWPAYKFNVAIEWKSQAGSPMEKVATYRLTWNSHEQKWYVNERF